MIETTNNIQWPLSNKSVFLPQDLFRCKKRKEKKNCCFVAIAAVILLSAVVCVAVIKQFCLREVEDFTFQ